ncbi:hypothetical protein GDO81_019942 [Engystomops pustulosus]|uniref:Uncharacterized protein n=1 Tax=Engystomops pustulosus TaxID=76066 RepID=A0AAV6YYE0_ENGPU|nr:hypothetical protein GDO81_019942 [Engystomops pustulosus]
MNAQCTWTTKYGIFTFFCVLGRTNIGERGGAHIRLGSGNPLLSVRVGLVRLLWIGMLESLSLCAKLVRRIKSPVASMVVNGGLGLFIEAGFKYGYGGCSYPFFGYGV